MNKVRIVLTGGHAASTAFVVISEVRRQKKPWAIYWIGPKSSFEAQMIPTLSSIYFPRYGIKAYEIIAGRIQRKLTFWTIPSLIKIPIGFIHALFLLLRIKPDAILSFGGFSAFPVVVVGWLLRIPVVIHEQTSVVGRANKLSSYFAKTIAISRDSSRVYFPRKKTVLTGNPIPRGLIKTHPTEKLPRSFVIFITSGQSGSITINAVVGEALDKLLETGKVIHLTGLGEENKFKKIRKSLDKTLRKRYQIFGIVDPERFNRLFNKASLVISRAGANTVSKIVASHKPSILIPIPISYLNEQEKNALFAKKLGLARVINQDKLSAKELLRQVKFVIKNYPYIVRGAQMLESPDVKAAENLVKEIEKVLK